MKSRKFVDSVKIYVKAGDGGSGVVSFRREKYVPRGGPDGGDGGKGGDVLLRVDPDTDSLIALHYAPHVSAEDGRAGGRKRMHGRNGRDRLARVPPGTEIHLAESGQLIGDLVAPHSELRVARGGKGGWGNCHWVSPSHQAPMEYTEGEPGEAVVLRLELKLIADAGLVGLPNAGKSSLLAAVSNAHPRVASYPFTTLNPVIGSLVLDDYRRIRIADIPGLIEGAHAGSGLGDAFLRHVERSRLLVLVLDMAGTEGRRPEDDYHALQRELELYQSELATRRSLLVANKMDLPAADQNLDAFARHTGQRPLPVSALTGAGIEEFKEALVQAVDPAPPEPGLHPRLRSGTAEARPDSASP